MRISHIKTEEKPASIIVRNNDNKSIVHNPSQFYYKEKDASGQWKVRYFNDVPKEYNQNIVFDKL